MPDLQCLNLFVLEVGRPSLCMMLPKSLQFWRRPAGRPLAVSRRCQCLSLRLGVRFGVSSSKQPEGTRTLGLASALDEIRPLAPLPVPGQHRDWHGHWHRGGGLRVGAATPTCAASGDGSLRRNATVGPCNDTRCRVDGGSLTGRLPQPQLLCAVAVGIARGDRGVVERVCATMLQGGLRSRWGPTLEIALLYIIVGSGSGWCDWAADAASASTSGALLSSRNPLLRCCSATKAAAAAPSKPPLQQTPWPQPMPSQLHLQQMLLLLLLLGEAAPQPRTSRAQGHRSLFLSARKPAACC